MQITKHFSLAEMTANLAIPDDLMDNMRLLCHELEYVRMVFGGRPIVVTSGYRDPEYNARIGGAERSYHTKAMAADFHIKGISHAEVHRRMEDMITGGLISQGGLGGPYIWGVHYDIRGKRARWRG